MAGNTYEDRATCPGSDPTPEPSPPPPPPPSTAIIAGAVAVGSFAVVVVCVYILYQKKNSKPFSVMRRTNRSTTLEESDTQPPLAVEPGNTGTLVESTREEEEEAIRLAFEILDRDQNRNLARRLDNIRR